MQILKNWLREFWPQHFVVCLGLFGLGNIWAVIGIDHVTWMAAGVYLITLAILLLRAIVCFDAFCEDWKDTSGIIAYLLGALDACFLAKVVAQRIDLFAGIMIWSVVMGFTVVFVLIYTIMTFKGGFDWEKIAPPMFLVYCSFGIGAIVAPDLGLIELGKWVTIVSLVGLVIVYPLVLIRVATRPLPELLMPTLMLFGAAPCMNMVAWVNNFGVEQMEIPVILVTVGQLGFVYLIIKAPVLVSVPFNKNFGAFTFPPAIGAMSMFYLANHFYTGTAQFALYAVYALEMLIAMIIIACVVGGFVIRDIRCLFPKKAEEEEFLEV